MKKTGIFILLTVTLVFAAFVAGFYAGRNSGHADIQISTLPQTLPSDTLAGTGTTAAPHPPEKININTADTEALEALPKIGPKLAQRIVDYRLRFGYFRSIDELKNVEGIGDGIIEAIRDYITV